ncbi:RNA polymerase sigma factor SigD [Symmachiella macrocystis]|uniref:RNA polymerase sigma factor SigD n=1 Tax=Symmachiella macrocystis TaxID=2527985 RepID=A0A5C6B0Q4_9PLAN|nr:sigma-70 family RNA polymerase sigma factor [Symmachiella macrocystis]TWU05151.1 RNA polymerase sigma factor SigD [Symmachiella macrocystis]
MNHRQLGRHRDESTRSSLLNKARANDEDAWQRLTQLYGPLIRCWCRRRGLRDEAIDDVVQEVLLSVTGALGRFRRGASRGSFRAWLRRITENKIRDHFRRCQHQPNAPGGSANIAQQLNIPAEPISNETGSNSLTGSSSEVMAALDSIRETISERTWRAFVLVTFRDFSPVEAATELNMTSNAVRLANGRVRNRLRSLVSDLPS